MGHHWNVLQLQRRTNGIYKWPSPFVRTRGPRSVLYFSSALCKSGFIVKEWLILQNTVEGSLSLSFYIASI